MVDCNRNRALPAFAADMGIGTFSANLVRATETTITVKEGSILPQTPWRLHVSLSWRRTCERNRGLKIPFPLGYNDFLPHPPDNRRLEKRQICWQKKPPLIRRSQLSTVLVWVSVGHHNLSCAAAYLPGYDTIIALPTSIEILHTTRHVGTKNEQTPRQRQPWENHIC